MFNQMTDQTYYVWQNITELKLHYDQLTGQRHDMYKTELVQNEFLEKQEMIYPRDKDSEPYKQEYCRHMQEKPKIGKKWAN